MSRCKLPRALIRMSAALLSVTIFTMGVPQLLAQTPAARFGLGGSSAVAPRPIQNYDAFPFASVFAPPAFNSGYPQPLGHQIVATGRNGYIYRPVTDLADFIERAFAALRSADYDRVLVELEPVLAESPDDGNAWLLQAQALFCLADYAAAAEALQIAMQRLPQQQWGEPIVHRREYFRSDAEYNARLTALEAHVASQPGQGAGHFLLGYHYGYLGRAEAAERELRTALRIMAGNQAADALLAPIDLASTNNQTPPSPGLPLDDAAPKRPSIKPRGQRSF